MKEVFSSENETDIVLLKGALEEANIESITQASGSGNYFNHIGIKNQFIKIIYVKDCDYENALRIIKDYEKGRSKKRNTIKERLIAILALAIILIIILYQIINVIV